MTREAPKLALAWTDGVRPKRYASARFAYYAIAKRMVVAKYPPTLDSSHVWDNPLELGDNWTHELVERRLDKMRRLFYSPEGSGSVRWGGDDPAGEHFDDRRWKRFVLRVARFLAFVDSKRTAAELLELRFGGLLPAESLALAEAEYEKTERAACKLAEEAGEIRRYIDARSKR